MHDLNIHSDGAENVEADRPTLAQPMEGFTSEPDHYGIRIDRPGGPSIYIHGGASEQDIRNAIESLRMSVVDKAAWTALVESIFRNLTQEPSF